MKETSLRLAMHPVIGRIKIQRPLRGRLRKRSDELLDDHLMHRPGPLPVGAVRQPAERRTASQRTVALDGRLPRQIVTQRVVIIEILIALGQPLDALAHPSQHRMFDALGIARIRQHFGQGLGQPKTPVGLAQPRDAAIAGDVPAGKAGGHVALFYGWKLEKFRVANCTGRNGGFPIHVNPIDIGPRTPWRLFLMNFSG
jgi:hypothetical protein